jgi:hypothetical protein
VWFSLWVSVLAMGLFMSLASTSLIGGFSNSFVVFEAAIIEWRGAQKEKPHRAVP